MRNWNYSDLSHNANIHGGPEKYIEMLQRVAYKEAKDATNRKWLKHTFPLIPFAAIGIITVAQKSAILIQKRIDDKSPNDIADSD